MPKQRKKTPAPMGNTVVSWTAPEYVSHRKSMRWYMVAAVVVALTLVYSALTFNWTMGLAVIVFTAVYQYTHLYHPPKNIRIDLTELGVRVGDSFFAYSQIQAFWIYFKPGLRTLNLRIAGNFWADVVIQLGEQDPVAVRSYLVGQVPEWEGKEERLGELILRMLKL
jgi:hypothetical protein